MQDTCTLADKYQANLFHSGYYSNNNCHSFSSQTTSSSMENYFIPLHKELLAQEGELNKVWVREFSPGVSGMVATEDIAKGELIAYIPRTMITS